MSNSFYEELLLKMFKDEEFVKSYVKNLANGVEEIYFVQCQNCGSEWQVPKEYKDLTAINCTDCMYDENHGV